MEYRTWSTCHKTQSKKHKTKINKSKLWTSNCRPWTKKSTETFASYFFLEKQSAEVLWRAKVCHNFTAGWFWFSHHQKQLRPGSNHGQVFLEAIFWFDNQGKDQTNQRGFDEQRFAFGHRKHLCQWNSFRRPYLAFPKSQFAQPTRNQKSAHQCQKDSHQSHPPARHFH